MEIIVLHTLVGMFMRINEARMASSGTESNAFSTSHRQMNRGCGCFWDAAWSIMFLRFVIALFVETPVLNPKLSPLRIELLSIYLVSLLVMILEYIFLRIFMSVIGRSFFMSPFQFGIFDRRMTDASSSEVSIVPFIRNLLNRLMR